MVIWGPSTGNWSVWQEITQRWSLHVWQSFSSCWCPRNKNTTSDEGMWHAHSDCTTCGMWTPALWSLFIQHQRGICQHMDSTVAAVLHGNNSLPSLFQVIVNAGGICVICQALLLVVLQSHCSSTSTSMIHPQLLIWLHSRLEALRWCLRLTLLHHTDTQIH